MSLHDWVVTLMHLFVVFSGVAVQNMSAINATINGLIFYIQWIDSMKEWWKEKFTQYETR